jgi:hypothetical protein
MNGFHSLTARAKNRHHCTRLNTSRHAIQYGMVFGAIMLPTAEQRFPIDTVYSVVHSAPLNAYTTGTVSKLSATTPGFALGKTTPDEQSQNDPYKRSDNSESGDDTRTELVTVIRSDDGSSACRINDALSYALV